MREPATHSHNFRRRIRESRPVLLKYTENLYNRCLVLQILTLSLYNKRLVLQKLTQSLYNKRPILLKLTQSLYNKRPILLKLAQSLYNKRPILLKLVQSLYNRRPILLKLAKYYSNRGHILQKSVQPNNKTGAKPMAPVFCFFLNQRERSLRNMINSQPMTLVDGIALSRSPSCLLDRTPLLQSRLA